MAALTIIRSHSDQFHRANVTLSAATTAAAFTDTFDAETIDELTIFVASTFDQTVTFQVQGSHGHDAASDEWHDVGSSMALTDGSVTKQINKAVIVDYYPVFRVKYTASVNTSAGSAVIRFRGRSE